MLVGGKVGLYSLLTHPHMWSQHTECSVRDSCVRAELLHSCLTFCDPMDCGPPDSCGHQILQARILEWVAVPFSRGSSRPRDQRRVSHVSCIGRQVLCHRATWIAPKMAAPAGNTLLGKITWDWGRGLRCQKLSSCSGQPPGDGLLPALFLEGASLGQAHISSKPGPEPSEENC